VEGAVSGVQAGSREAFAAWAGKGCGPVTPYIQGLLWQLRQGLFQMDTHNAKTSDHAEQLQHLLSQCDWLELTVPVLREACERQLDWLWLKEQRVVDLEGRRAA
jgi:hypothetical protein